MDTILITGAEGFFASRFIQFYKGKCNIIGLRHSELDITNQRETIEVIKKINPTYLIHAAAISDTGACVRNPELSYNVNVRGSINIAKGCSASNTKLVYLSSDQVYNGNSETGPYNEEVVAMPNTVYGKHKIEAENQICNIVQEATILRLTWLFSLPERNKKTNSNIIWNVVKAVMKNEAIKFPVNEYRGITYVYDLIENFNKILHLPSGIYNVGSENNLSTYETAEVILKEVGLNNRCEELLLKDDRKYRDLRISNSKLSEHNIYFTSTEEAVKRCINDFAYKIL